MPVAVMDKTVTDLQHTPVSQARFSVAPMMDWTDRHCRYFHRQLAPSALLYTEMVTTGAVIHGDRDRLLAFHPAEHPVALQLGGSDPDDLARAAQIGRSYGYDEINLNVGCPSDRVQSGAFGACLMKEPGRVRDGLAAMVDAVDVPVTIKTRIGVDGLDSEAFLMNFVETVLDSGVRTLILHARKAWLSGLSPKENREVPELNYARVHAVKARFPELRVILNGGITDLDTARREMAAGLDGVMLGRAAYKTPWVLTDFEAAMGRAQPPASRREAVMAMVEYAREQQAAEGVPVKRIARHMLGLYQACPGARSWRQRLSQNMHLPEAGPDLLLSACPEGP